MSRYHKLGHCVVGFYEDSREGGKVTAFIFDDEELRPIQEIKNIGGELYEYYTRASRSTSNKEGTQTD